MMSEDIKNTSGIKNPQEEEYNVSTNEKKEDIILPDEKKEYNVLTSEKKGDNVATSDKKDNNILTCGNIENNVSTSEKQLPPPLDKPITLDGVMINELGQFGWFQLRNILLVAIPIIISGFPNEYVFSAAATPHRCRIPECGESEKLHTFQPEWLGNAVPQSGSTFSSCQRYSSRSSGSNGSLEFCPVSLFDQSSMVKCESYVYGADNTVVYEFDLGCQDWLRALAGTLNSIGTLLVLPITGYISDRFGRRTALIVNVFNIGLFGLLRSFSVNYTMYLILQIVQTTLGAGTYSSSYIFITESVGPKYRVFASATSSSLFATGEVVLGAIAWLISPWRKMLMTLSIPCFFLIVYHWILPESVRWLLAKKKYAEAEKIIKEIARVNKREISNKSLEILTNPPLSKATKSKVASDGLLRAIIGSPILLRRVLTTPIWWISTVFIYYGLSINSTSLSDTMHLNYILTCAIEIPGFYTAVFVLDRIGRKATLTVGYFFSAACNIVFIFLPNDWTIVRLTTYLLGKFSISTVMTSMYLYTSELYPTEFRHTFLAFSSMIGRIGQITAPLTPVLMNYWHGIPSVLFGIMGLISGLLVFTQPETLGTKMPDTIAEAESLGKIILN